VHHRHSLGHRSFTTSSSSLANILSVDSLRTLRRSEGPYFLHRQILAGDYAWVHHGSVSKQQSLSSRALLSRFPCSRKMGLLVASSSIFQTPRTKSGLLETPWCYCSRFRKEILLFGQGMKGLIERLEELQAVEPPLLDQLASLYHQIHDASINEGVTIR
jgi:hypothetical protein